MDLDPSLPEHLVKIPRGLPVLEVDRHDLDRHTMGLAELCTQSLEPLVPPGGQDERVTPAGEDAGQFRTDSAGCSCNQRPAKLLGHGHLFPAPFQCDTLRIV